MGTKVNRQLISLDTQVNWEIDTEINIEIYTFDKLRISMFHFVILSGILGNTGLESLLSFFCPEDLKIKTDNHEQSVNS